MTKRRVVVPYRSLVDWLNLGDERVADAMCRAQGLGMSLVLAHADWVRYAKLLESRGVSVEAVATELELADFTIAVPELLDALEEDPVQALLDDRTTLLSV